MICFRTHLRISECYSERSVSRSCVTPQSYVPCVLGLCPGHSKVFALTVVHNAVLEKNIAAPGGIYTFPTECC